MIKCAECGKENLDYSRYCTGCGLPLYRGSENAAANMELLLKQADDY